MKITGIKTVGAFGGRQTWSFVLVETDAGITGVGEASVEGKEKAVEEAVQDLARLVVGRDPMRIEQNWQIMYRHGFWRGGIVLNSALSGIDQALWDIAGKELGVPVYQLLGGAARDRVELYCHSGGRTVEEAVKNTKTAVDAGWGGFKTGVASFEHFASEGQCIDAAVKHMTAIREAVGPDIKIMIDAHGKHRPGQAIKLMRALEPLDLYFFEEPVPPDDPKAYARLAGAGLNINIATGERLFTKWGYRELLENQYVDIIQPDVCHCGGITELRKIANMAETYYVRVAPHNPNGPVATMSSIHAGAALANFCILEYAGQSWRHAPGARVGHDAVVKTPLKIENGYVKLPTDPGLGIELDLENIATMPYQPQDYYGSFWPDGGVADI